MSSTAAAGGRPKRRRSNNNHPGSPSRPRSRVSSTPSHDDDSDDRRRCRSQSQSVWRPHSDDGEFTVLMNDYDHLFSCRSCHRMLSSPVYQCAAAHVTCSRCHAEGGDNRCSWCGDGDGYGRGRAIEKFLDRISFACRNREHGCEIFLPQREMRAHERSCRLEPCFCPVPRCGFAGPTDALEEHLAGSHRWDVVTFRYGETIQTILGDDTPPAILRSEEDGELFHINSFHRCRGTVPYMICIRRDSARKQEFTYEVKTPSALGDGGRHRLQMESTVWNTSLRYGMGEAGGVFLMIPDELPGTEFGCLVKVLIRKVAAADATMARN